MSKLPKISSPLSELTLPSTNTKILYRPFKLREEKILLIAQETKDFNQAITSIKQVISNCVVDQEIDQMALFDIEYILLMLRAKSVDNIVSIAINDPETKEKIELTLDLNEVKFTIDPSHSKEIQIGDGHTLIMKYPTINDFTLVMEGENSAESNYQLIMNCLDVLVRGEEIYKFKDFTDEDKDEFLSDLEGTVLKKIKSFFETIPTLRHELSYTNSKGTARKFVIEGLKTFFI